MSQRNQQHKSGRYALRSGAALLLTVVLTLSCLTGCAAAAESSASKGGKDSESAFDLRGAAILGELLGLESETPDEEEAVTPADPSDIKIGVSLWADDDPLARQTIALIDRAASLLGVEVQYAFCDQASRRIRRSVSDLIDAGCDGILLANRTDSDIAAAIRLCDEKGVYLAQLTHWINEERYPETYALAQASPYYVGAVHGEERTVSYRLVTTLLEAGDRNIGYITWSESDTTQFERHTGYHMATEAFQRAYPTAEVRFAEPVEAATAEEGYRAFKQMMEDDPELEAVVVSGGGGEVLDGVLAAVSEMGLVGVVNVAAFDATDSMRPLLTSGAVYAAASGTYCQGLYGFLLVLDAARGTYVKEAGQIGADFSIADLFMLTSTNARNYDDSFVNDQPYTNREIRALADLTVPELKKSYWALTLTDVLDRHAKETFEFPSLSGLLSSDDEEEEQTQAEKIEEEQAQEAKAAVEDQA